MHEPHAVLDLSFLVLRGGLERAPEIVEDRDQLLHQPLVGALGERACSRAFRLRKLSNSAASRCRRSRADRGQPGERRRRRSPLRPVSGTPWDLVCHSCAFGASCSSSMTS